jgi:hypothetical protein
MITNYMAQKFLPAASPVFHKMSDTELLSIVGWAQKWPVGKVYDTAFEQVFPEKQLKEAKPDFDEWFIASENPRLPIIVREELIRAFRIHMASGRMDVLRLGALAEKYAKRMMYVGLFFLFLILVF